MDIIHRRQKAIDALVKEVSEHNSFRAMNKSQRDRSQLRKALNIMKVMNSYSRGEISFQRVYAFFNEYYPGLIQEKDHNETAEIWFQKTFKIILKHERKILQGVTRQFQKGKLSRRHNYAVDPALSDLTNRVFQFIIRTNWEPLPDTSCMF